MTNPPGSFIWYELLTTDLAGARRFYAAVAGLDIPADPAPGPQDYRMIATPDGGHVGGAMELSPEMCADGARPMWLGYVSVPDVDTAAGAIAAAGGEVHISPMDVPGAGRIAMVSDPQGAPFYVMTPTPPPGAEDQASTAFDPERPGRVAWNELHAADGAAALDFYIRQVGWEKSDAMDMGPMGIYQMFKPGGSDRAIGAVMTNPNMPHPLWLHYLNVADIDAAHQAVGAEGGRVLHGPSEVPGGAFIVQGTDPQGAMFALVGPRKAG